MVLVLYGFMTQTQALQFEWAWQRPERSKFARPVVQALKRHQRYGLHGKVRAVVVVLGDPGALFPSVLFQTPSSLSVSPLSPFGR